GRLRKARTLPKTSRHNVSPPALGDYRPPDGAVRARRFCEESLGQKRARGFIGEPVAPTKGIGASTTANSRASSSLHVSARASRLQLSSSHRPMAAMPMPWMGPRKPLKPDGWVSCEVSAAMTATPFSWKNGRHDAPQPACVPSYFGPFSMRDLP